MSAHVSPTRPSHGERAEELAHQSLDGDYGNESHRLRLAAVAQVYATLHVADALENLGGQTACDCDRGVSR